MKPKTNPRQKPPPKPPLTVGSRVKTRHSLEENLPANKWPKVSGVIVEDFGEVKDVSDAEYGRDWAVSKRWAVALDDGNLVFRDDPDLEAE